MLMGKNTDITRIGKQEKQILDNIKYDLQHIERKKISNEEVFRRIFSPRSPIKDILLEDSVNHKSRGGRR